MAKKVVVNDVPVNVPAVNDAQTNNALTQAIAKRIKVNGYEYSAVSRKVLAGIVEHHQSASVIGQEKYGIDVINVLRDFGVIAILEILVPGMSGRRVNVYETDGKDGKEEYVIPGVFLAQMQNELYNELQSRVQKHKDAGN